MSLFAANTSALVAAPSPCNARCLDALRGRAVVIVHPAAITAPTTVRPVHAGLGWAAQPTRSSTTTTWLWLSTMPTPSTGSHTIASVVSGGGATTSMTWRAAPGCDFGVASPSVVTRPPWREQLHDSCTRRSQNWSGRGICSLAGRALGCSACAWLAVAHGHQPSVATGATFCSVSHIMEAILTQQSHPLHQRW